MSGGHYDYQYRYLDYLADSIECDFVNEGVAPEKDYGYDMLNDATKAERKKILAEMRRLIHDLRLLALRSKELEWYLSGDTGAKSYLKRLGEILNGNNSK
jgi:hypothetical protein